MTCENASENISKISSPARRPRRVWIVLLVILGAWGWYRGTLYWRVTSERDRLIALETSVTDADWVNWGKAPPGTSWLGHARRWVTGKADIQRLDEISQRLDVVEGHRQD